MDTFITPDDRGLPMVCHAIQRDESGMLRAVTIDRIVSVSDKSGDLICVRNYRFLILKPCKHPECGMAHEVCLN
jgi:hypothetical protein